MILKRLAALMALAFVSISPLPSAAQSSGYVLGYINGVNNDPIDAQDGLEAVSLIYGAQSGTIPIRYTLFYPPTDSLTQDVVNAFAQRTQSSPGLTDRWELVWDIVDGGGGAISDLAIAENPSLSSLVSDLKSLFLSDVSTNAKSLTSNPEFQPAVDQFVSALTAYSTQQTKVLVVAHSEGNVYLNAAYDTVKPQLTTDSLRTVAVATPTATVRDPQGRYVTSTTDLVIQTVALALGNVEPANTDGPILATLSGDSAFGHSFVNIYMNPSYKLFPAIKALTDSNLLDFQATP